MKTEEKRRFTEDVDVHKDKTCKAICRDGDRCSMDVVLCGYCTRHFEIYQRRSKQFPENEGKRLNMSSI